MSLKANLTNCTLGEQKIGRGKSYVATYLKTKPKYFTTLIAPEALSTTACRCEEKSFIFYYRNYGGPEQLCALAHLGYTLRSEINVAPVIKAFFPLGIGTDNFVLCCNSICSLLCKC